LGDVYSGLVAATGTIAPKIDRPPLTTTFHLQPKALAAQKPCQQTPISLKIDDF